MEKEFGKIKKNEITDIIVRIDDFGGKPGLTIREFTTSDRYTGFTKSGTRISAESFRDFKAIIDGISQEDFVMEKKKEEVPVENEKSEEQEDKADEEPKIEDISEKKSRKKKKIQEEVI